MVKHAAEATSSELGVKETLALTILQDKLFNTLLNKGPRKTGELVSNVDHPSVTLSLAKHALRTSPRFTETMRKWDIAPRWDSPQFPFEQLLEGFLRDTGRPLSAETLGAGMAGVLERDVESMTKVVRKFLAEFSSFTEIGNDCYGLSSWLVNPDYKTLSDVEFYNFLDSEQVEAYRKQSAKYDWDADFTEAAIKMCKDSTEPVLFKALAIFAWEAEGKYLESGELYQAILADKDLAITSDQKVYKKADERKLLDSLKSFAASMHDEIEEEEEAEDKPPMVSDEDVAEAIRLISGKQTSTILSDVILKIFELEEDERAYRVTREMLSEHLRHNPDVLWVGGERFQPVGLIAEEIKVVPESLVIPEYDFATPDGEKFDIEMEVTGIESGLTHEIHEFLAQDVGDEDPPEKHATNPDHADCVLKYHHKLTGTFPLAQLPDGLFPAEPSIQEVVLRYEGQQYMAWVNLDTRLIYNLSDLYSTLDLPISGGLFRLNTTSQPDIFDFEYPGEPDETAHVQPGRLLELLQLKDEADTENLPTFEIMCRMLERHNQGLSYARLLVELNLIRRVKRVLVASILSGYSCFTRAQASGLWVYDAKKKDNGFTKSKRRYVVKEY